MSSLRNACQIRLNASYGVTITNTTEAAEKLPQPHTIRARNRAFAPARSGAGAVLHRAIGTIGVDVERTCGPLYHFTRDHDFLQPWLRHPGYCIVYLDVSQFEAASFIRRVPRHRSLNTTAKRMGTVVRAGHDRLAVWRHGHELERLDW